MIITKQQQQQQQQKYFRKVSNNLFKYRKWIVILLLIIAYLITIIQEQPQLVIRGKWDDNSISFFSPTKNDSINNYDNNKNFMDDNNNITNNNYVDKEENVSQPDAGQVVDNFNHSKKRETSEPLITSLQNVAIIDRIVEMNNNNNNNTNNSSTPVLLKEKESVNLKLPKPIINVGFPKAGTSTIFDFFNCNGLKTQHFYCCKEQNSIYPTTRNDKLMSSCILHNLANNNLIFDGCGTYDVYTEIDGPRNKFPLPTTLKQNNSTNTITDTDNNKNIQKRTKNKKRLKVRRQIILDDGSISKITQHTRYIFPQHHYLDKIHEQYPNATFILNKRPVNEWINSVIRWHIQLAIGYEFYYQQIQPRTNTNLKSYPNMTLPTVKRINGIDPIPIMLQQLYNYHNKFIHDFVMKYPSHTLIEIDITNNDTGIKLANTFGLNANCWGHSNQNKQN